MLEHATEPAARAPHSPVVYQQVPASSRGMLSTAAMVNIMNEVCARNSVFTSDMGEHLGVALHCLRTRTAGSFLTCLGFGSMGSGVVSSIGHALGDPSRRVYAICGDGGFLMSGNELQTAVRYGVPVTFVVINDGRYNMCHHGMRDQYGRAPQCDLGGVNFAELASAFGATGMVIHDVVDAINGLRLQEGPVVLDVRIDPDVRLQGSQRVAALRQFSEQPQTKDADVRK
jgi:acetolactate synthase-1/2/3 large subunit